MQSPSSTVEQRLGNTVLVVEDQRIVAADLAMQLRSFGYRVVGMAASGPDAIKKAKELTPDIVLMDVHLEGDMDGTEAARLIRAQSDCAIVFLTAYSDSETLARAKLASPGGYVVKPASPVELRCAVEVALHKQQLDRTRAEAEARGLGEQLVTVKERVRELEQAYMELETFSSSLTHDLRNPLQVIHGATEMLSRTQGEYLSETGRAFLSQVESAVERMMERLTELLEHGRSLRSELIPTQFSLSELAQEVWSELANRAPGAVCTIAEGMQVRADRGLMRRVLENLLSNAVKFTTKRDQARIEVGHVADDRSSCYFVRDNGLGFDMKSAEGRLFTPYGRLHDVPELAGTGLGLAGARRIIERHGGRMWAHAIPDDGATFYFSLPLSS